jgi:hypothetical protein
MTRYKIKWKSLATDAEGEGSASFPKAQAQQICDALNNTDKDIRLFHWIEPVREETLKNSK